LDAHVHGEVVLAGVNMHALSRQPLLDVDIDLTQYFGRRFLSAFHSPSAAVSTLRLLLFLESMDLAHKDCTPSQSHHRPSSVQKYLH
jgi:hypothetical protein